MLFSILSLCVVGFFVLLSFYLMHKETGEGNLVWYVFMLWPNLICLIPAIIGFLMVWFSYTQKYSWIPSCLALLAPVINILVFGFMYLQDKFGR